MDNFNTIDNNINNDIELNDITMSYVNDDSNIVESSSENENNLNSNFEVISPVKEEEKKLFDNEPNLDSKDDQSIENLFNFDKDFLKEFEINTDILNNEPKNESIESTNYEFDENGVVIDTSSNKEENFDANVVNSYEFDENGVVIGTPTNKEENKEVELTENTNYEFDENGYVVSTPKDNTDSIIASEITYSDITNNTNENDIILNEIDEDIKGIDKDISEIYAEIDSENGLVFSTPEMSLISETIKIGTEINSINNRNASEYINSIRNNNSEKETELSEMKF